MINLKYFFVPYLLEIVSALIGRHNTCPESSSYKNGCVMYLFLDLART